MIDFYADWCGPCRNIAPFFEELSNEFSEQAVFVKVNTQTADKIAESFRVSGIPYFVFMKNGRQIDSLTGANKEQLKEKLVSALNKADAKSSSGKTLFGIANAQNLAEYIEKDKCECLNEDSDFPWNNVLEETDACLKSDCDEQLILKLQFRQPVKLFGIKLIGGADSPNKLRVFINQTMPLDFDKAENGKSSIDLREIFIQNLENLTKFCFFFMRKFL